MDRDKIREILRLERRCNLLYKERNDIKYEIRDFKNSLSDNPTDEEIDKLCDLEEEYELRDQRWNDANIEFYNLKGLKEGKKKNKEGGFFDWFFG